MDIMRMVQYVGKPMRGINTLVRRALKTAEETGELAEATLSVTSESNGKKKALIHVIEEAVDVTIMGLDIAMTKPEEWDSISDKDWIHLVEEIFEAKLAKWQEQAVRNDTLIGEKLPSFTDDDRKKFIESLNELF